MPTNFDETTIRWLHSQQSLLLELGVAGSRLIEATSLMTWLVGPDSKLGIAEAAVELEQFLVEVLWSLGDETNRYAAAARRLYGADSSTMYLDLARRRDSARRLIVVDRGGLDPEPIKPATWSRNWEPTLVRDVAFTMWRLGRAHLSYRPAYQLSPAQQTLW